MSNLAWSSELSLSRSFCKNICSQCCAVEVTYKSGGAKRKLSDAGVAVHVSLPFVGVDPPAGASTQVPSSQEPDRPVDLEARLA